VSELTHLNVDGSLNPSLVHPNAVRNCARDVAADATFVRISTPDLERYAVRLARAGITRPKLDETAHFDGAADDLALYIMTLNAINFGSGYFPWLDKDPGTSGYFTVAKRLKSFFESSQVAPNVLATMTTLHCAEILGQSAQHPIQSELMTLFASALRQLGSLLLNTYGGSALTFIDRSNRSVVTLIRQITVLPFYQDIARYRGRRVPLLKRAQLLGADLAVALPTLKAARFDDLRVLTLFADNLIPHVLHQDGVLIWDQALSKRVALGRTLTPGSLEEVELRACSIHAVELLSRELEGLGVPAAAWELDYWLWNRGQSKAMKAQPRPRIRTVAY